MTNKIYINILNQIIYIKIVTVLKIMSLSIHDLEKFMFVRDHPQCW